METTNKNDNSNKSDDDSESLNRTGSDKSNVENNPCLRPPAFPNQKYSTREFQQSTTPSKEMMEWQALQKTRRLDCNADRVDLNLDISSKSGYGLPELPDHARSKTINFKIDHVKPSRAVPMEPSSVTDNSDSSRKLSASASSEPHAMRYTAPGGRCPLSPGECPEVRGKMSESPKPSTFQRLFQDCTRSLLPKNQALKSAQQPLVGSSSYEKPSPPATSPSYEKPPPSATSSSYEQLPPPVTSPSYEKPPLPATSSYEKPPPPATSSSYEKPPPSAISSSYEQPPPSAISSSYEQPPPPATSSSYEQPPPPATSSSYEQPPPPATSSSYEQPPPPATSSSYEQPPPPATSSSYEQPPPPATSSSYEQPPPPATSSSYEQPPPPATSSSYEQPSATSSSYKQEPPSATTSNYEQQKPPATSSSYEQQHKQIATPSSYQQQKQPATPSSYQQQKQPATPSSYQQQKQPATSSRYHQQPTTSSNSQQQPATSSSSRPSPISESQQLLVSSGSSRKEQSANLPKDKLKVAPNSESVPMGSRLRSIFSKSPKSGSCAYSPSPTERKTFQYSLSMAEATFANQQNFPSKSRFQIDSYPRSRSQSHSPSSKLNRLKYASYLYKAQGPHTSTRKPEQSYQPPTQKVVSPEAQFQAVPPIRQTPGSKSGNSSLTERRRFQYSLPPIDITSIESQQGYRAVTSTSHIHQLRQTSPHYQNTSSIGKKYESQSHSPSPTGNALFNYSLQDEKYTHYGANTSPSQRVKNKIALQKEQFRTPSYIYLKMRSKSYSPPTEKFPVSCVKPNTSLSCRQDELYLKSPTGRRPSNLSLPPKKGREVEENIPLQEIGKKSTPLKERYEEPSRTATVEPEKPPRVAKGRLEPPRGSKKRPEESPLGSKRRPEEPSLSEKPLLGPKEENKETTLAADIENSPVPQGKLKEQINQKIRQTGNEDLQDIQTPTVNPARRVLSPPSYTTSGTPVTYSLGMTVPQQAGVYEQFQSPKALSDTPSGHAMTHQSYLERRYTVDERFLNHWRKVKPFSEFELLALQKQWSDDWDGLYDPPSWLIPEMFAVALVPVESNFLRQQKYERAKANLEMARMTPTSMNAQSLQDMRRKNIKHMSHLELSKMYYNYIKDMQEHINEILTSMKKTVDTLKQEATKTENVIERVSKELEEGLKEFLSSHKLAENIFDSP